MMSEYKHELWHRKVQEGQKSPLWQTTANDVGESLPPVFKTGIVYSRNIPAITREGVETERWMTTTKCDFRNDYQKGYYFQSNQKNSKSTVKLHHDDAKKQPKKLPSMKPQPPGKPKQAEEHVFYQKDNRYVHSRMKKSSSKRGRNFDNKSLSTTISTPSHKRKQSTRSPMPDRRALNGYNPLPGIIPKRINGLDVTGGRDDVVGRFLLKKQPQRVREGIPLNSGHDPVFIQLSAQNPNPWTDFGVENQQ